MMNRHNTNFFFKRTPLLAFLFLALLSGSLCFAWMQGWIIFILPSFEQHAKTIDPNTAQKIQKQEYLFVLPRKKNCLEKEPLLLTDSATHNTQTIITMWLSKVYEEGMLEKQTSLQTVSLSKNEQNLILSFDRAPFNKQANIQEKLLFLDCLCKTLRPLLTKTRTVTWLVHHTPLMDYHIDTSQPWPITGFIEQAVNTSPAKTAKSTQKKTTYTIMIDPAGDAANKGRLINGTFERGITLQCAEQIKQTLQQIPAYRVVLTRFPGETIEPLQNAMFSNRLQSDIFINLNFFWKSTEPAECSLFYYTINPSTDHWEQELPLWLPVNLAYKSNLTSTQYLGKTLEQKIKKNFYQTIAVNPLLGLPIKPLLGLTCPAISIEFGLTQTTDLSKIMPAFIAALKDTLTVVTEDTAVAQRNN